MKYDLGEKVQWSTPRPNGKGRKEHSGIVVEVVAAGSLPTKAGNWVFTPRDHESYVMQDNDSPYTFWPKVKWIMTEGLYYIQDTRSYCGNSCFWWRVDGKGYTCDLNEAWKVPSTWKGRDTDKLWPCAEIDAGATRQFDAQKLRGNTPLQGAK